MTGALGAWVSTVTVTTAYLTIALQMVVCGTGMGLISAPATESIMGAVPVAKDGETTLSYRVRVRY